MATIEDSRQRPLFDVRQFLPRPYDEWSFFGVLERFGDLLIRASDFPSRDYSVGGAPDWCPVLLSKPVLLQQKHGWPDREAVERARCDLRVKACLGLGIDQEPPSQPTLVRHRQTMQSLGLGELYMGRFVELARLLNLLSVDEAVLVDSVPVHGAGQVLDTYNLLAAVIRKGLRELSIVTREKQAALARRLGLARYLARSVKGTFEIEWDDAEARRELLATLVADARRLRAELERVRHSEAHSLTGALAETPNDDDPPHPTLPGLEPSDEEPSSSEPSTEQGGGESLREVGELIDDVLDHDVQFDAHGEVRGIIQRPAGDRPISATDPDMRHGRKSACVLIAGFKAQIIASVVYAFILLTSVIRANEPDGRALPGLIRALRRRKQRPPWCGGDHAYGTLANHHFFESLGRTGHPIQLVARMPRPANGGRFTKDEFELDFETRCLRCPAGHTASMKWAKQEGKKGWLFEFPDCGACTLRSQCVSPKAAETTGRSVFVFPDDEKLIRDHLERRQGPEFRSRLSLRPTVERAIAGFAQCGGKQSRRFGLDRTAFDTQLSALAHNLRRLGSLARRNAELQARLARVHLRPRSAHATRPWCAPARLLLRPIARLLASLRVPLGLQTPHLAPCA